MKILHIYKDYYPVLGGIENHLRVLAEGLAKRGHEVSVIVCHPQQRNEVESINGVRVIRAARVRTIASTPLSFDLQKLIAQEKPDVTHLHFPYPVGEVSHWLRGHGRTVITYHSDVVRQRFIGAMYKPIMRWGLRRAESILATSPNYVVSSTELIRLGRRCLVLPLGVDVDRFAAPQHVHQKRPTLLFVGRHRYYKGIDDLLKAMTDIEAELIIGGDGVMRESWERLAASLNVDDRVRFVGTIPESELASLYRRVDIFVLPASARSEAFGTVLLEAMAAGLPCVTTELGTGTSYVVQHNVSGLVVPARTPSALAESINHLLADESLRRRMGEAGQERARSEFTEAMMIERIENVYKWVME